MSVQIPETNIPLKEQRFLFPCYQTWEQFEALEALMSDVPALRISYLDGSVEFITNGPEHERIITSLGSLLEAYFFQKGISFIHTGSSTRRERDKSVAFQIEESYCIGKKKEEPDIAIEIILIGHEIDKLEKYRRFQITEVWFWENNRLSLYRLRDEKYEEISRSEFLPALDIDLLGRCVGMSSRLEARTEFFNGIRRQ